MSIEMVREGVTKGLVVQMHSYVLDGNKTVWQAAVVSQGQT